MRIWFAALAGAILGTALPVSAQSPTMIETPVEAAVAPTGAVAGQPGPSSVRLEAGWAEPDGRRIAGLRMDLAPGWKTYWRRPGTAGLPPRFDWAGSRNVADLRIVWPTPDLFQSYGMLTIGYHDRMVLPLAITAEDPARPIRLRLALSYGVCSDICVPAEAELALDIGPGARPDGEAEIRAALSAAPERAGRRGLTAASCAFRPDENAFEARLSFDPPPAAAPVVVAEAEGVAIGHLESRIEDGEIVARGEARAAGGWLSRDGLRLTILGDDRAMEVEGCASP